MAIHDIQGVLNVAFSGTRSVQSNLYESAPISTSVVLIEMADQNKGTPDTS